MTTLFYAFTHPCGQVDLESTDVTARRETSEEFRLLVENAVDMVVELTSDGKILYVSPHVQSVLGLEPSVLRQTNILKRVYPGDFDLLRVQLSQGATQLISRCRHRDGSEVWLEISRRLFLSARGDRHYVLIARDITERKKVEIERQQLEARWRQTQKLETLGTLASAVAHDFNNILGAILAYTELARMETKGWRDVQGYLEHVLRAATRAKELVRQILTFNDHKNRERRPIRLNHVIWEALGLFRATLPHSIELAVNLCDDSDLVLADPTQIHQVVLNLCTNAAHAMRSRSGRLSVSLTSFTASREFVRAFPEIRPGPCVRLTVTDTGIGMNAATRKRIFEPFFTTRKPGEGTGLGLAVVHGIVREHKGAIEVISEPEAGATFHVILPAHATSTCDVASIQPQCPKAPPHSAAQILDLPGLADEVKHCACTSHDGPGSAQPLSS